MLTVRVGNVIARVLKLIPKPGTKFVAGPHEEIRWKAPRRQ
jgi:hypothetical protein